MFDVIVVGSGPAGTAASLILEKHKSVLMLDVGNVSKLSELPDENFYDQNFRARYHRQILGEGFSYLSHINGVDKMVKLRAPNFGFVLDGFKGQPKVVANGFNPILSYSKGGLANAWGFQLYQYLDQDLKDFPISYSDLMPHYQRLHSEIGISGVEDDLVQYYGSGCPLEPPHQLSQLGQAWLRRYKRNKSYFNKHGITIGYPRLGMNTNTENGGHLYNNLEFLKSTQNALYTPSKTLQKLIDQKKITYRPGFFVHKFAETDQGVVVSATDENGDRHNFRAKHLFLAAGAINSAALVLNSSKDYDAKLPILDNPLSYIPFLDPFSLHLPTQRKSYYNQLNLMYSGVETSQPVMGTFYAITGIFNTELLNTLPFDYVSSMVAAKNLFPAMMILHLWYPRSASAGSSIMVNSDGEVLINHASYTLGKVEKMLIRRLRRIGLLSHSSLCQYPLPGNSIHYAGTLPMKHQPTPYSCNPDGLLFGKKSTYVVDGACLPSLSSKNHSLTIMANAMRIASRAVEVMQ